MTINLSFDGNLTADPELRFTPSGAAVVNFTVAHTPGHFDRTKNEWVDDETIFLRCSMWRDAAENVAASLTKGTAVVVAGRLQSRSYETKEGDKRTNLEVQVDNIGPSLKKATANVHKTDRSGPAREGNVVSHPGAAAEDPWATPAPAQAGWGQQPAAAGAAQQGGWGRQASYDEPPF